MFTDPASIYADSLDEVSKGCRVESNERVVLVGSKHSLGGKQLSALSFKVKIAKLALLCPP